MNQVTWYLKLLAMLLVIFVLCYMYVYYSV